MKIRPPTAEIRSFLAYSKKDLTTHDSTKQYVPSTKLSHIKWRCT